MFEVKIFYDGNEITTTSSKDDFITGIEKVKEYFKTGMNVSDFKFSETFGCAALFYKLLDGKYYHCANIIPCYTSGEKIEEIRIKLGLE